MKRTIIIFLLLCGVCFGLGKRPVFVKVYKAWKDSNYTVEQVMAATDEQVAAHAGLDADEIVQWKRFKKGIKGLARAKIKARLKLNRKNTIIIPDTTAIIVKLKAEGLTTAEAKAELLAAIIEELQS